MADSFTPQLRMVQQTDQANTNIWGKNWNEGVIDLIETAIAGRQDIDVTFASQTLSIANGGPDTSRAMMLHIIGNPGEAREIIVPSLQKAYVISNETSPGFDVEIKTAANSGVTIQAGTASLVYVDQPNDVVVSPITAGNTVTPLQTPFLTTVFDINNATAGDTTITVEYARQGNLIYIKFPTFLTTISSNDFTLMPQTSVPVDLIPSGPLSNEYPMCMFTGSGIFESYLQIPPANADWLFLRADGAVWPTGVQRALQFGSRQIIAHVVNP